MAAVGGLIGLKKKFTPRGLRRSFNDMMRLARAEAVVSNSILGHQTDRMREHYSTVTPGAQRHAIGNVVQLFEPARSASSSAVSSGGKQSGEGQREAGRK